MKSVAHIMLAVCTAASTLACAESLTGRVVGISDGDTLTVAVERREIRVRLADIDAPEMRQAFGTRSTRALSDLCAGKEARLETRGRDRSGSMTATVHCAGRNANAEQVWQGMAWVFDRNARPDSPLYILQEQAKSARRGLWSEPKPVPPWQWRGREQDRKGGVAPSEIGASPAGQPQPQATPRKWVCDRKEIPGQDRAAIDCGWR